MTSSNPVETNIQHSITKKGFPGKAVKLPFKPVYDSCKQHATSLASVLENLKSRDIFGTLEGDFIVFRSRQKQEAVQREAGQPSTGAPPAWTQLMANMMGKLGNLPGLPKDIQSVLSQLTPEQIADIKKQVETMSPEDKKNLFSSLSKMFTSNPDKR